MKKFFTYLFSIASALGVGVLAGILTRGSIDAYSSAVKPPLSPPPIVFPIVWTVLYILMGIGLALVLTSPRATDDSSFVSIAFYVLNLCFNFLWPIWFFVFRLFSFSFVWLLLLLAVVLIMTLVFSATSKWAAYLQIPYIVWLVFAAYLNVSVAILN